MYVIRQTGGYVAIVAVYLSIHKQELMNDDI